MGSWAIAGTRLVWFTQMVSCEDCSLGRRRLVLDQEAADSNTVQYAFAWAVV
jgi:hypothetical protein